MSLTIEEIREKKGWLGEQLKEAIQKEFNLPGISISPGIGMNKDGDLDFAIRITNLDDPENAPSQEIVEFARGKVSELVPGSKPDIRAMDVPVLY